MTRRAAITTYKDIIFNRLTAEGQTTPGPLVLLKKSIPDLARRCTGLLGIESLEVHNYSPKYWPFKELPYNLFPHVQY